MKYKIFLSTVFLWAQLYVCAQILNTENQKSGNPFFRYDSKIESISSFIENASAHSTIYFNKNEELVISEPLIIGKPMTLIGLNARLPDSLGKTSIIEVYSEHVNIRDFKLTGNASTVGQDDRAPLIRIYKSNFRVESGEFFYSSKDGVEISPQANSDDIDGGVVRDIIGRGCVRDVISINGSHEEQSAYVRNILVENIRGYDSSLRGPVEVSDGSENITVRKVYAENCVYAVDWQDHNRPTEINKNVLIDDVYAMNCRYAIRNAVQDFGHFSLTLTNIVAEKCEEPLKLANTSNLILQNVRIIDHTGDKNPIVARNCDDLTLRNISISNSNSTKAGVLIENCNDVLIDGVSFLKNTKSLSSGVTYSITKNKVFENLRITNVSADQLNNDGIVLKKENKASLKNYIVWGNIAGINDLIKGKNALLKNNL